MKHLLDYNLLQEWGFIWATRKDFGNGLIVTSYEKSSTSNTDAHGFKAIQLRLVIHLNFSHFYELSYSPYTGTNDILFRGVIRSKKTLDCVLRSCIVFK